MANTTHAGRILRYGVLWPGHWSELKIEIECVREGGQWTTPKGTVAGKGMFYHFKRVQELLWPDKIWHRWNTMQTEAYLSHRTIGVLGPASSGKTNSAATDALTDYYCWPECTTIICCSTTKERLQDRIFGEMMKYHKQAREVWKDCPGHLIEGRLRIVTDSRESAKEGRDFRNGVIGVPCKPGGSYTGLGDFVGIKNKRLRLVADELQLLPHVFIFSVSNLDKNPDFKCLGLGNPKETTDALGVLCEPSFDLGGWDGGIDQQPGSKTWATRRPDGVAVQLMGSDSPNLDGKLGIPLITQEHIDRDIAQYGKDSLQYTMMNEGMMPRGQGSRRVLTRQLALKNHAFEDPVWASPERTRIGFLDAAFGGVGGDRCIFGELQFGQEAIPVEGAILLSNMLGSASPKSTGRQILALIDTELVPVSVKEEQPPEDQIAFWVREECRARNIPPENFFFDAGMKSSLVAAFARIWSPQVVPVDFGGAPTERMVSAQIQTPCKDYYSKFVTELWYSVREIVTAGQFRGMTETVLREFCLREWTKVGNNKIEVETKQAMKLKTGYSPDLADAVAIGVEGARRKGFVIQNLEQRDGVKTDSRWRREAKERATLLWRSKELVEA